MIAFLGTGLLGSGFVRALRRRGEEVHVWNRTPAKAKALEQDGARAFEDPAEAVRGAARVHLALQDDASVDATLARAQPGLGEGSVLVDHTTTSTAGAAARAAAWASRGVPYLHAPVFMGPANALAGTGLMLVSGERALVEALRPALAPMTGNVVDLGPRPDAAAAFKLMGNAFLMCLTGGLADVLMLAKAMDVPAAEAAKLFDVFNPGASVGGRLARMIGGAFTDASWELAMARKDARLMVEEAAQKGLPLALLPAIAARMDALLAEGHAHDDWTVLAKDAL